MMTRAHQCLIDRYPEAELEFWSFHPGSGNSVKRMQQSVLEAFEEKLSRLMQVSKHRVKNDIINEFFLENIHVPSMQL
jgi:hypothetical protein